MLTRRRVYQHTGTTFGSLPSRIFSLDSITVFAEYLGWNNHRNQGFWVQKSNTLSTKLVRAMTNASRLGEGGTPYVKMCGSSSCPVWRCAVNVESTIRPAMLTRRSPLMAKIFAYSCLPLLALAIVCKVTCVCRTTVNCVTLPRWGAIVETLTSFCPAWHPACGMVAVFKGCFQLTIYGYLVYKNLCKVLFYKIHPG